MGNVRSARWAGNGWDCLDVADAPTIGHIGRLGEPVGSSGGRRVGGPKRRGVRSLHCSATRSLAPGPLFAFAAWPLARLASVAMDRPEQSSAFTVVLGRPMPLS